MSSRRRTDKDGRTEYIRPAGLTPEFLARNVRGVILALCAPEKMLAEMLGGDAAAAADLKQMAYEDFSILISHSSRKRLSL